MLDLLDRRIQTDQGGQDESPQDNLPVERILSDLDPPGDGAQSEQAARQEELPEAEKAAVTEATLMGTEQGDDEVAEMEEQNELGRTGNDATISTMKVEDEKAGRTQWRGVPKLNQLYEDLQSAKVKADKVGKRTRTWVYANMNGATKKMAREKAKLTTTRRTVY